MSVVDRYAYPRARVTGKPDSFCRTQVYPRLPPEFTLSGIYPDRPRTVALGYTPGYPQNIRTRLNPRLSPEYILY